MDHPTREQLIKMMKEKVEGKPQASDGLESLDELKKEIHLTTKLENGQERVEKLKIVRGPDTSDEESLFPEEDDEQEDYFRSLDEKSEDKSIQETKKQPPSQTKTQTKIEPAATEQTETKQMVELPQTIESNFEETAKTQVTRIRKASSTQKNQEAITALKAKFDKELDILRTMHRLERWQLDKQHQQLEAEFIEEYKEQLKNLEEGNS